MTSLEVPVCTKDGRQQDTSLPASLMSEALFVMEVHLCPCSTMSGLRPEKAGFDMNGPGDNFVPHSFVYMMNVVFHSWTEET